MSPNRIVVAALIVLAGGFSRAGADPEVPGATVEAYANAAWPAWLSFDHPSGVLYTGVETGPATEIWHIGAGGGIANPYGATPILDPDAVLHDAAGAMTGIPGSVLVGGRTGGVPQIFGILPDPPQTVVSVFGPSSQWTNLADMEFDSTGRLLFGDENGTSGRVFAAVDPIQAPVPLYPIAGRIAGLEVDGADRIFTSTFDGKVRLHAADGSVISDPFLSGLGNRILPIAVGPGGPWGTDLYTVNQQTGELLRAAAPGQTTVVGTGFDGFLIDFEFGPDGALYVSDLGLGTIWRIAPESTTAVLPLPEGDEAPSSSSLRIEHPNPAWLPLAIRYEVPVSGRAQVRIYDIQGRWMRTLVDDAVPAGPHTVEWDGRDAGGRALPAGTYFFRVDANLETRSSKVLILH